MWWRLPPPAPDKARAAAAGYNVLNATGDWQDVIAIRPSMRCISPRPMSRIFPSPRRRFEAGKHVLCEKPLAMSVAEAQELIDLAGGEKAARRAVPQSALLSRWCSRCARMREAGDFGDILVVQGTYSQDWMLYETDWNWRVDPAVSGAVAGDGRYRLAFLRHGRACHGAEGVGGVQRPADLLAHPQTAEGRRRKLFRQAGRRGRNGGHDDRHRGFRRHPVPHGQARAAP